MVKLTHYTNYQDLKKSQKLVDPKQLNLLAEIEFKEFITLLTEHRIPKKNSWINKDSNPSIKGKESN